MSTDENERAALREVLDEARAAGETTPATSPDPMFRGIATLAIVLGILVALYVVFPCVGMRILWFINGAGMRECAWAATCSINDGSMPHVPVGAGYIWFEKDAPSVCRGVQF